MDPVSIIGLIASVIAVADVAVKCRRKLSEIKSRYRNIPQEVTTLIGHLYIVQAALDQLSEWTSTDLSHNPRYQDLALDISMSLESFGPLILSLYDHLDKLDTRHASNVTAMSAISFIWNKRDVSHYLTLIDRQVNALNLLLSAIQCSTWAQQRQIIDDQDSRTILQLAKECTPSIEALADASSAITRNTNAISVEFDFDNILSASRVYITAHRSHLKQALKSKPAQENTGANTTTDRSAPVTAAGSIHSNYEDLASADDHVSKSAGDVSTSVQPSGVTKNDLQAEEPSVKTSREQASRQHDASHASPIEQNVKQDVPPRPDSRQWPGGVFLRTLRSNLRRRRGNSHDALTKAKSINDRIDAQIRQQIVDERRQRKVLLLGPHGSGKTTLLRAMIIAATGALNERDRGEMIACAQEYLVFVTQAVLEDLKSSASPLNDIENAAWTKIIELGGPGKFSAPNTPDLDVLAVIRPLYTDKDFIKKFADSRECPPAAVGVVSCLEGLTRLAAKPYDSTDEDMLKLCSRKTTGITETSLKVGDTTFHVMDVGGARSERKKWIHTFEGVQFVVSLIDATSFCKGMMEDVNSNCLDEELMLFETLVRSEYLVRTNFILFINRIDLVEEILSFEFVGNERTGPGKTIFDFFPELVEHRDKVSKQTLATLYVDCLERKFVSLWEKRDHPYSKLRLIRANLVDHQAGNPAKDVFEAIIEMHRADEESH